MSIVFWILAMVPMVVLRSGENVFDEPKVNPCIRMDQHCMYCDEYDVNIEYSSRKTQHIQGNESHCSCKKDVHKVRATTCEPIHVLGRMMDRVEAP